MKIDLDGLNKLAQKLSKQHHLETISLTVHIHCYQVSYAVNVGGDWANGDTVELLASDFEMKYGDRTPEAFRRRRKAELRAQLMKLESEFPND